MIYHVVADIKQKNVTYQHNVPDMGKAEPLLTDEATAKQTVEWLRARAPDTDTFQARSGKPPLRPIYDLSRLGERPKEAHGADDAQ